MVASLYTREGSTAYAITTRGEVLRIYIVEHQLIKYDVLSHQNSSRIKQKKFVYFVNGLFSNVFVTVQGCMDVSVKNKVCAVM